MKLSKSEVKKILRFGNKEKIVRVLQIYWNNPTNLFKFAEKIFNSAPQNL